MVQSSTRPPNLIKSANRVPAFVAGMEYLDVFCHNFLRIVHLRNAKLCILLLCSAICLPKNAAFGIIKACAYANLTGGRHERIASSGERLAGLVDAAGREKLTENLILGGFFGRILGVIIVFELIMGFGRLAWRVWAKWARKKGEKSALFEQKRGKNS